ncbi:MAG TPA: hypothetical protein DEB06_10960 [Phycisphaerales bacterium]|nr:hypothetical protein [Phycisphaerales bacterium]
MTGHGSARLAALPAGLRARTRFVRLASDEIDGGVPALLAHPREAWWDSPEPSPAPVVIWMHGRSVNKELDPGRYLRWVRAGIGACAIDLPGHGEREVPGMGEPERVLEIAERVASVEIDAVVRALAAPALRAAFDASRMALGGMSLGGMTTMIRLCRPHPFVCATVEAASGDFRAMAARPAFAHPDGTLREEAARLNPIDRLSGWRSIPFLALHSELDEWVPVAGVRSFVDALRARATDEGADPAQAALHTWPRTGAPYEHVGFGRFSNEAKNLQTEFLARHLGAAPSGWPAQGN